MDEPSVKRIAALRRRAFALASQQVGRGDSAYDLLRDLAGQNSLGGLNVGDWLTILARLDTPASAPAPAGCTLRQWALILDLRRKLNMSDAHWRNWLAQRFGVDHERFLRAFQFRGVIAALLKMKQLKTPGGPQDAA